MVQKRIDRVGVIYNPVISESESLSSTIEQWLVSQHTDAWTGSTDNLNDLQKEIAQSEILVILGGDGTTLHVARQAAPYQVPVFGVNMGRVGFLSESSLADWRVRLGSVLAGDYWVEKRLMLKADVNRQNEVQQSLVALNDVVVSRGVAVRVVRFHLYVDGDHVTTYMADGLIAATPTGSTAYSMAAGGPLLPPQLQNFLVLPVAPHLSFERPLVLHQNASVKIQVELDHEAIAAADGQDSISLVNGDEVFISKYECDSFFARIDGPSYFYNRLMQRLSYWSIKQ